MQVARSLLPKDPDQWHGFLRDYFCDKDAHAASLLAVGMVNLELAWPADAQRHIDPALSKGLAWWARGVTLGSMWSSHWREGRIMTTLFDTWTLLSWSEWLKRVEPAVANDFVVLHVDDHRDLGSPRLIVRGELLFDAITGAAVNIQNPTSVRRAIESGAIGMGSFMTPLVHEFPNLQVRHLCQPPKVLKDAHYAMGATYGKDALLCPGEDRLHVNLAPLAISDSTANYLATGDAKKWASGVDGRPALVHIDMDYFNNRYDGDSDWLQRAHVLDPALPTMQRKVDELIDALAQSKAQIEDVVIAYSPGFFPAEYWEPLDHCLRRGLRRIL